MPLDREVLTTGEVAKLCNVAPRTVSKWFDSGQLKGYRIPGSKDRRIPVNELVRFMKAHGIPLEGLGGGQTRLLVADADTAVVHALEQVLSEETEYEVMTATTAFRAGVALERFKPNVLLIDLHIEGGDGRDIAAAIHAGDAAHAPRIIAMSGKLTDGQAHGLRAAGFDAVLKKPFQVRQVIESIDRVTRALAA